MKAIEEEIREVEGRIEEYLAELNYKGIIVRIWQIF